MIGDTGEIKFKDVQKAVQLVKENKDLLLAIWEMIVHPDDATHKKLRRMGQLVQFSMLWKNSLLL